MTTEEKPARGRRSAAARGAPATARTKRDEAATKEGGQWYIRHQGTNFQLLQSDARPSDQHAQGARQVRVHGPYPSEDAARKVFARYTEKGNAVEAIDVLEGGDAA